MDASHNPEFTLLELYQAYTDYHGMMDITEGIIKEVAEKVAGSDKIVYQGVELDFSKPFERITMLDAVKKYTGVDFDEIPDTETAKKVAKEHNVEFEEVHEKGDILNLFFEEFVEDKLIQLHSLWTILLKFLHLQRENQISQIIQKDLSFSSAVTNMQMLIAN